MKLKSIKRILYMGIINHVLSGTRAFSLKRNMLRSLGFSIGDGTKIVGPLFCTGTLSIGDDCWIGRNLTVHGNGCVSIGNRCDVAPDVTFLTGGHEIGSSFRRAGVGTHYQIRIGDGTWVGAKATIGKSISIGDSCVIAACSCVMQNIADNTLVGGVPAKPLRMLE